MNAHHLTILILFAFTLCATNLIALLWHNIRLKNRAYRDLDKARAELTFLRNRDEIERLKSNLAALEKS